MSSPRSVVVSASGGAGFTPATVRTVAVDRPVHVVRRRPRQAFGLVLAAHLPACYRARLTLALVVVIPVRRAVNVLGDGSLRSAFVGDLLVVAMCCSAVIALTLRVNVHRACTVLHLGHLVTRSFHFLYSGCSGLSRTPRISLAALVLIPSAS